MRYDMPVELYFEPNAVQNHGKQLASLGKRAMIVTGKHSSRQNGSLRDVTDVLDREAVSYVIFDDIEENPSVETVVKAAKEAVEQKVDFVIGLGGGSPMDASKAIALLAKNPALIDLARTVLYEASELAYLPLVEIPTTSGTGSEVTPYSILTLHDCKTKQSISHRIYAKLALVDAGYLRTASYQGMISTCVDALAHLVESYLNVNASTFSRMYAKEGLALWGSVKEVLLSKEAFGSMQEKDYERFMEASVLAGIAIAHTGTSLPHGLSYPVTYETGMAHGKAVGIFLPGFLSGYEDQEAVGVVLSTLGFSTVEAFRRYMGSLLGEIKLSDALWEKDKEALLSNPAKLKNYPFPVTEEKLQGYRP